MKRINKLLILLTAVICFVTIVFASSMQSSAARSISAATVSSIGTKVYTGTAVTPSVTVKYGSATLVKGTHYTVSYKNNINTGIAYAVINGKGAYSGIKYASFYIVSPAVNGLSYKNETQSSAYLFWNSSPKASGYQIYKYDAAAKAYKFIKSTTATGFNITNLAPGSSNSLKVRPYNRLSNGKYIYGSFCRAIWVYTRPANITQVSQTAAKTDCATITWNKSTGAAGYQIYIYNTDSGKYTFKTAVRTNYAVLSNLEPSLSTYVRIRAYKTAGDKTLVSSLCPAIQLKTLPCDKITNLTAAPTSDSITLRWDEVNGATLYRIYQLKDAKWTAIAVTEDNYKTVSSLSDCTDYLFRVVTCVKSGDKYFNSTDIAELSASTCPKKISALSYADLTYNLVRISWKSENANSKYYIYKFDNIKNEYTLIDSTDKLTYTASALTKSTQYLFAVRASYTSSGGNEIFGEYSDICKVKTLGNATSIAIKNAPSTISANEKYILTCEALPKEAYSSGFSFSSSNAAVASVSSDGTISGLKSGTAVITVTSKDDSSVKAAFALTITAPKIPVSKVVISTSTYSMYINEVKSLSAYVEPSNATDKTIKWNSSNTGIVSVDANGKITAKAVGTATVTATSNDSSKSASCTVTVKAHVSSVSFSVSALQMSIDEVKTLTCTVLPANASNKTLTYVSSNPDVISVDSTGKVTAKATGSATITATSTDMGKTASCVITVLPDTTTPANLFYEFSSRLNKIKSTDLPAFTTTNNVKFSNVDLKSPSIYISKSTFASLFDDFIEDETVSMAKIPDPGKSSTDLAMYRAALPVKNYSISVIQNLDTNTIDMTRSGIKDGNKSYDITLTLKDETFNSLPTSSAGTSHGKMFDILYASYMERCLDDLNGADMEDIKLIIQYSGFKTKYHDSSIKITVDKAADKVIAAEYNMNVSVYITKLKMGITLNGLVPITKTLLNSDVSFDVCSSMDITFTY